MVRLSKKFGIVTEYTTFIASAAKPMSTADAVRDRLLEKIYATDLSLAEKDHVARAVRELDAVADRAERVADQLTIYAIKRAE